MGMHYLHLVVENAFEDAWIASITFGEAQLLPEVQSTPKLWKKERKTFTGTEMQNHSQSVQHFSAT